MDARKQYNQIFMDTFGVSEDALNESFTSSAVEAWDSLGHMNLISAIEEEFDIMMDGDDIMAFQSYPEGIEILKKYKVEIGD